MSNEQQNKQLVPLNQRLAALRTGVSQVRAGQVIAEAQEALPQADLFFGAVKDGDTIGIAYLNKAGGKKLKGAVSEWLSLTWDGWFARMGALASGGDQAAQKDMQVLLTFAENTLLYTQLRQILWEFERPCRQIYRETQLVNFLEDLASRGLVVKTAIRPRRRAIHLGDHWYFPAGLDFSRIGWQFVVQALGRVRGRETREEELLARLQPLLEGATLSSTPEEKGLTQIIEGNTDSAVIWDPHSWVSGKEAGLLALLIGRFVPGTSLILMGSIADTPLPQTMTEGAYELPSLITNEKEGGELEAGFGKLSGYSKEEHQALLRIERLIQWRLRSETRSRALTVVEETAST